MAHQVSLSGHMARGAAWMTGIRWCIRSLDFVTTLILARLLVPDDFGVYAIGTLVVGLLEVLTQAGIDLALIRNTNASKAHFNAAWTIQVIQGIAAAVILFLIAPGLGFFFGDPRVVPVIQLLAIRPLIQSFTNIGAVSFLKELDYRREFWFGFYKKIAAVLATLLFALVLRSYMALVFGTIVGSLAAVVTSYRMHPFRPSFSLAKAREIFSFSAWILFYYAAEDCSDKVDRLVVGRTASSSVLGQYQLGWLVASMPFEVFIIPLWRALIPVYARQTHDPGQLVNSYLNVLRVTAFAGFAVGFGIAAVAEDLVVVLLGESWRPAAFFTAWLALVPAIAGIVDSALMIVSVTGHSKLCALHSGIRLAVVIAIVPAAGMLLGFEQVAKAYLACTILLLPLPFFLLVRVVPVTARAILNSLWRPVIAGAVMFAVIKALHSDSIAAPAATLAIDILLGAFTYIAANLLLWLLANRPEGPETLAKELFKNRMTAGSRRVD